MAYKRCLPCSGSGKMMGGGMMMQDCEECDGRGKIKFIDDEIDYLAKKQTQTYSEAKERLKTEANLSDEDAQKYLDDELASVKKKRKRSA